MHCHYHFVQGKKKMARKIIAPNWHEDKWLVMTQLVALKNDRELKGQENRVKLFSIFECSHLYIILIIIILIIGEVERNSN